MPCYKPLPAFRGLVKSGETKVTFGLVPTVDFLSCRRLYIPCGTCFGCRLEHSRQWAMRCVYEASLHEENSFITLTYAPEFLPEHGSLVPEDLTKFFKRLRESIAPKKIRYFACGEYGSNFNRPHYHAILFGHKFDHQSTVFLDPVTGRFGHGYRSPHLDALWGLGHTTSGEVSFESCAYVARYVMKKYFGTDATNHYGPLHPEFSRMSRRPGIASGWFDKFRSDVTNTDTCLSRGHPCKPPRYFDKCLERIDSTLMAEIKVQRAAKSREPDWDELDRLYAVRRQSSSRVVVRDL